MDALLAALSGDLLGTPIYFWVIFLAIVVGLLAFDLGVLNRKDHEISAKESLTLYAGYVIVAALFGVWVWFSRGAESGLEFFTGYLIELCLSVDNVFVFIVIFQYFRVEPRYQHRVLFWGIIGAVVMRAIFIFAGVSLINKFHWIIYVFGAFLIYTGIKLAAPKKEDGFDPEKNPAVKLARRVMPVTDRFEGGNFFTRVGGKLHATPMFLVLLIVETTDVMFALDSIPAVIAITRNEFIIFTSNIFAILGLRSLYFAVSGVMKLFRFINIGLSVILVFVGCKMLATYFSFHVPIGWSLSIIATVLAASILASVLIPVKDQKAE